VAIYGPSVATEVFPICYHPPPPGIGGLIRHINIHTLTKEIIMTELNSTAAMTATQITQQKVFIK
jgi:hypothetical protein